MLVLPCYLHTLIYFVLKSLVSIRMQVKKKLIQLNSDELYYGWLSKKLIWMKMCEIYTCEPKCELWANKHLSFQSCSIFLCCVNVMHGWIILELVVLYMLRPNDWIRGIKMKKATSNPFYLNLILFLAFYPYHIAFPLGLANVEPSLLFDFTLL